MKEIKTLKELKCVNELTNIIIDYYAPWLSRGEMVENKIDSIDTNNPNITVYKCNADDMAINIKGLPTFYTNIINGNQTTPARVKDLRNIIDYLLKYDCTNY
jgi:hypothetical protein